GWVISAPPTPPNCALSRSTCSSGIPTPSSRTRRKNVRSLFSTMMRTVPWPSLPSSPCDTAFSTRGCRMSFGIRTSKSRSFS
ncbi:hypothetical protein LLOABG_LLOABG_11475, partial [Dysosmobacter welbionis]